MTDRRDRAQPRGGRDYEGGQSRFAQRGLSHEERMVDDDSASRFPGRSGPEQGFGQQSFGQQGRLYGSGGSYGYGGAFEHDGQDGYEESPARGPSAGARDTFYESTGGFGYDASSYARHGLGSPGRNESRLGPLAGPSVHGPAGAADDGRLYAAGDPRGLEGGGAGPRRFRGPTPGGQPRGPYYGLTPQGYTRSDERIRDDVCDQLSYGHVDPSEISVRVQSGLVQLDGYIATRREKFQVEEIVEQVLGVKDVDNRLRLKRETSASEETSAAPSPSSQGEASDDRSRSRANRTRS